MELTFWVGREIRNKIKIGKHGDVSVKQEEQTGKVSGGVQILDGKARQPLRRQRLMKAERVRRPPRTSGGRELQEQNVHRCQSRTSILVWGEEREGGESRGQTDGWGGGSEPCGSCEDTGSQSERHGKPI